MEWYQQLAARPGESSGVTYFRLRAGKGKNYKQNKVSKVSSWTHRRSYSDKKDIIVIIK